MPFRSPKIKGFILGFQRFVWWPKWTPASSRSFMAIAFKTVTLPRALALTELEALARASHAVFLAFLRARVACEQPSLAQRRAQRLVVLDERPGNPQAERPGLAGHAAAGGRRQHV